MSKKYSTIVAKLKDGVKTIYFDRPSRKNAMSHEMMVELISALNDASVNDNVVLTVLTGKNDFYCSGMDMKSTPMADDFTEDIKIRVATGRKLISAFIDFPKILIAIVNGPAIGIAVTTLGLCDIVYATPKATFWTPFASLGICAEGCSSYLFPRIMGYSMAGEMLYANRKLSAEDAMRCGLVADVLQEDQMDEILAQKFKIMVKQSHQSLLANKKLVRQWNRDELHLVNNAEWDELMERFQSSDFTDAVIRFMQKSKL